MKRRPVFLLEIIIAMALVGLFASFFLRSSIRSLYKESQALAELEYDRLYNLRRMEAIDICVKQLETLPRNSAEASKGKNEWNKELESVKIAGKTFKPKPLVIEAWVKQGVGDTYKLILKENKTKFYFVFKKEKPKV